MADVDLVDDVAELRDVDHERFIDDVDEERARLKDAIAEGVFNNPQGSIGLEYEFYAVAEPDTEQGRTQATEPGCLMRVPRRLLEMIGFEKELGLHNAEMCTSPQPLNEYGLASQGDEVRSRLAAAQQVTTTEGMRLVSDGLWTIPPNGETAREYLTASATEAGVTVATNMSDAVRYHAMANSEAADVGLVIDAPHVSFAAETVMPESLITSIQPHYQVPQATDLPQYFAYALRVAAPLLALCANSPFFPPDLYDDGTTIDDVLADGWDEHRISVFETVLNAPSETTGKVRFPREIESPEQAVDRVADDELLIPVEVEEKGRYDDQFAHFRHKHGSFWRWVRPVFDGPSKSAANARIEFRPIAAQPTVQDTMAVLAAFAGLMVQLPRADHPAKDLEWETAYESFYNAMRQGLDAEIPWITSEGHETRDVEEVYDDILGQAAEGLRAKDVPDDRIDRYLGPLRARVEHRTTPASWKRDRAREAAEDGADLAEAIEHAQHGYLERQRETLLEGTFEDWLVN
jgi:gamma-glutamyl:cysteine ligase YbdK (ATP-grasp superfamily)